MKATASARLCALLACVLLLLAAGVFSTAVSQSKATRTRTDCSGINDEQIRTGVQDILTHPPSPYPPYPDVVVKVQDGEVKLKGTLGASGDIRNVTILAKQVPCVLDVITDGLKVSCSDAKTLANAQAMLSALPCGLRSLQITVHAGEVTLTGTVPSKLDKKNAARAIEAADCVTKVNIGNVQVVPPSLPDCQSITDTQLKDRIVDSLKWRLTCGAFETITTLTVANKVVTVRGGPPNRSIVSLAIRSAGCVANIIDQGTTEVPPMCTPGAISCMTIDGEQYCCFSCRICPRIQ